MTVSKLYRRRLIPAECILLKDDIILEQNDEIIVTKWNTLNPKSTFSHGCSCYFLKEGYKVSKFYRADSSLLYYYCDIISHEYTASEHKLVVTDLLADVIIYPDGFVKVVDLDELARAAENGSLPFSQLKSALLSCNTLLSLIYAGRLGELTAFIEAYE